MGTYEPGVFISYAWGTEREEIVNKLDQSLEQRGIKIIRDKRDLGYRGSIQEFMEQIGRGDCVILVISDKYLRSPNCMFELVEIAENKHFHDRIFPIVLPDANIYDPVKRLGYVSFWEAKRAELAEAMKNVDPANLQGIREDIDNYDRFRDKISGLTSILKDMNTLTPEMHGDSDFEALFSAIQQRLSQVDTQGEPMSKTDSSSANNREQKATSIFNQSGQTVTNQTNVAGDYHDHRVTNAGPLDSVVIEKLFTDLNQRIEKMEDGVEKTIAQTTVQGLKEEAEKGEKADETKVQKMFKSLLNVAPDAWDVAVATFVNPVAGVGMAFKKIAERAKAEQANK